MSAEDLETALTVGAAFLVAGEAHRNGSAPPRPLGQLLRTARRLFNESDSFPGSGPDGIFTTPDGAVLVEAKSYGAPRTRRYRKWALPMRDCTPRWSGPGTPTE